MEALVVLLITGMALTLIFGCWGAVAAVAMAAGWL